MIVESNQPVCSVILKIVRIENSFVILLTVVRFEGDWVEFDVIHESLNKSNLGTLRVGDFVDIERACIFGDEVGGHSVTGHVDCQGVIAEVRNTSK